MRPNPHEVRAWLAGDQTDDALAARLATLGDDPNWSAIDARAQGVRRLTLTYAPTGERLDVLLWWGHGVGDGGADGGAVWSPQPHP